MHVPSLLDAAAFRIPNFDEDSLKAVDDNDDVDDSDDDDSVEDSDHDNGHGNVFFRRLSLCLRLALQQGELPLERAVYPQ